MTLGDLIQQTTKLLEEYNSTGINYTSDSDVRAKIIDAVNTCVGEVSRIRAIKKKLEFVNDEQPRALPADYKSIKGVFVDRKQAGHYEIFDGQITVKDEGNVIIEYEAFPQRYSDATSKTTELELDAEACEILHYGVAKIILIATGQGNDATDCENKYYTLLQQLRPTVGARLKIHSLFGG